MSEPEREQAEVERTPDAGFTDLDADAAWGEGIVEMEMDVDFDADEDLGAAASEPVAASEPAAASEPVTAFAPAPVEALSETDAVIYAFQRNVVVAASAGTGKTHRLTALYVLLTLGLTSLGQPAGIAAAPVLPDRIVATTFSRAAAAEIAHRIERALRHLAAWDGVATIPFGDVLHARQVALGAMIPPEDLRRRAAAAIARWRAARIDTLHGVARQIVDRHAIALGLTPGARILDEEEAQALSDRAVDETLSAALGDGGERAEAARAIIAAAGGVDLARAQITRLLDRLDEEGLTPTRLAPARHGAEALALRREIRRLAALLAAAGSAAFQGVASTLLAQLTGEDEGAPLPPAAIGPILDLLTVRKPHKNKITPADLEICAFRDTLPGENQKEKAHRLIGFLREAPLLERREALIVDILEAIRDRLATIRRTEGGLGFGDLLRAARDGLRDDPAVARAVRETVDVLLVDEFQDTSSVQRDLVYLLRERDDAAARRPAGVVPTAADLLPQGLFLVGDRKQSIYGFRGADVSVFCRVCADLAGPPAARALELTIGAPGRDERALSDSSPIADFVALRESRRSTLEILEFVNAFSARDFAQDMTNGPALDFQIAYSAAEHLVPATGLAPSVPAPTDVVLVADGGEIPENVDALLREAKGPLREALVAAAYVARRVRGEAASASPERGDLRFRDIAVLTRRRSTIPLVELALARLDIPYVVAGRALFDASEIRDVAAILRLLLDPRDRLALATVLRGPMVALSDTALALLSPPTRGLTVPLFGRWPKNAAAMADSGDPDDRSPLPDLSDEQLLPPLARLPAADRERLEAFRAVFPGLRRAALRSTPGEAIRAAVAALDLDRVLASLPRAQARIGNIDRLVDIARRRGGSLASFVRWLDRRIHDDADEPEAAVFSPDDDAVRLTTIHGSKGLDFPAVILVDLNAEPRPNLPGIAFMPPASAADGEPRPPSLVLRHFARRLERAPRPGSLYDLEALALAPQHPILTPALQEARAEAWARERAERQRLTYVAITRARRELALIAAAAKPRSGSAWLTLKTAVDAGVLAPAIRTTLDASALLAEATPPAPGTDAYARPAPRFKPAPSPRLAGAHLVSIEAAPMALFQACPRRFRLRHILGLDEPTPTGQLGLFDLDAPTDLPDEARLELEDGADPRPPGRAPHRVLERWPAARWGAPVNPAEVIDRLRREGLPPSTPDASRLAQSIARFLEGPYARRARDLDATLRREEHYVIVAEPQQMAPPPPARGAAARAAAPRRATALALRGVIDIVVDYPGARIDVIDVRLARPRMDLADDELSLRAAALALHRRHPDRPIRAGMLFLGPGAQSEPQWLSAGGEAGALTDAEHSRFEEGLLQLADRLSEARRNERYDPVPIDTCRRLRCGFLSACHGAKDRDPQGP